MHVQPVCTQSWGSSPGHSRWECPCRGHSLLVKKNVGRALQVESSLCMQVPARHQQPAAKRNHHPTKPHTRFTIKLSPLTPLSSSLRLT
ncbi:hypothetical protein EMIT0373P_11524 [Pseudomonas chlororaphis]